MPNTSTEPPMEGVRLEPVISDDNVQTVDLVDFSIPVVEEGGKDKSVFIQETLTHSEPFTSQGRHTRTWLFFGESIT